jgi:chromosome segregation ATPase
MELRELRTAQIADPYYGSDAKEDFSEVERRIVKLESYITAQIDSIRGSATDDRYRGRDAEREFKIRDKEIASLLRKVEEIALTMDKHTREAVVWRERVSQAQQCIIALKSDVKKLKEDMDSYHRQINVLPRVVPKLEEQEW